MTHEFLQGLETETPVSIKDQILDLLPPADRRLLIERGNLDDLPAERLMAMFDQLAASLTPAITPVPVPLPPLQDHRLDPAGQMRRAQAAFAARPVW